MAFTFRLQKVLQHRKTLEDLARKSYLEARAQLQDAQNKLDDLFRQIDRAQLERHQLVLNGGFQGERLSQIHQYIKGTEILIERQKNIVRERLVKVEQAQLTLQEAAVDYKMIEKLEARQREEHRQNEKKLEEKRLTEMTNARFYLRQKNDR